MLSYGSTNVSSYVSETPPTATKPRLTMLFWILINVILSILVIYGGHYFWKYIKDTYSTKKTKDLVNVQIQKYKKIMTEMQNNNNKPFISNEEKLEMDMRLTEFISST